MICRVFEMMLAVYRNYSSRAESIYESSDSETKRINLISFVDKIQVNGGQGNEAIEVGFLYANRLADQGLLTQIILIGDMPPNLPADVAAKREVMYIGDAILSTHRQIIRRRLLAFVPKISQCTAAMSIHLPRQASRQ